VGIKARLVEHTPRPMCSLHSYFLPLKATSLVSAQNESLSSCLVKVHDIKSLNCGLALVTCGFLLYLVRSTC
jgi:hypothetical protein